jgi:formyltetrahydrofolate-dependent phosphoribosylglycinamide formyltransferase
MFQGLQKKWGVSTRQFWILFIVFGLTGTTTAYVTRYVTAWLGLGPESWWVWKLLLRLGMLVFGYQFILLTYGALFGQWAFFWKYERRMLEKLGILKRRTLNAERLTPVNSQQSAVDSGQATSPYAQLLTPNSKLLTHRLAVFASGAGSNAEKIIQHFQHHPQISIALIVCNKPEAGVLTIAEKNSIPTLLIERERFFRGDAYLPELAQYGIDFIVLAGFLWKIPARLVQAYPQRMVNIHPALLPKYGGKGMYGHHVHSAVIAAGETESGITIHYVNEHFDEGPPIFQANCAVLPHDTPDTLAARIHELEHTHFSRIIENVVLHQPLA